MSWQVNLSWIDDCAKVLKHCLAMPKSHCLQKSVWSVIKWQATLGHGSLVCCAWVWPLLPFCLRLQPARSNHSCLAQGSGYNSAHPTWTQQEHSVLSTDRGQLIAVSEAILHQTLTELAEVSFSLSQAACKANKWHLTQARCRTGIFQLTFEMTFHFWLFNTFKTVWSREVIASFWRVAVSKERIILPRFCELWIKKKKNAVGNATAAQSRVFQACTVQTCM